MCGECASVERRRYFLKAQRAERPRTRKEHGSGYEGVERFYADRAKRDSVFGTIEEGQWRGAKDVRAAGAIGMRDGVPGCGAECDGAARNSGGCACDVASRA